MNNINSNNGKHSNSFIVPDRVIIYKGELEYISRCILDYPNYETGGNLFGFYTTFRIPIIQYVIGPGENSVRSSSYFQQDETFFNNNADMLINDHALHHIGTWHSHHQLSIDHPSGGDSNSMFDGMKKDELQTFLLIIGTYNNKKTGANAYCYNLLNRNYHHCQWVVLNEESPIRYQFDKKHSKIIHFPHTNIPIMHQIKSVPLCGDYVEKKITYTKGYWLNDKNNKLEIKIIIDYLKNRYENVSFYLQETDKTLKITIHDKENIMIIFHNEFPIKPPTIYINNMIFKNSIWKNENSISETFINYFEGRKINVR